MKIIPKYKLNVLNIGRGPIEHEKFSNRWVVFCNYKGKSFNIEVIHFFPNYVVCNLGSTDSFTIECSNANNQDSLVKEVISQCEQFLYEKDCSIPQIDPLV